ncbi:hypothetical protein KUW19_00210 [Ferrimonas balearica]|uniref:hypothetical protein n=1 Tax=Ferrimonas balearica TaxID=44012 RepID=UPI001C9696D3|nr:hypothetical protein [Ferrimonas balearica]MBY6104904.1 hypothetical protein [Ferrimonas balearica]
MSHPVLDILDAIEAQLTAAGLTVIRNQLRPAESVPAVTIRMGSDDVEVSSIQHDDRRLEVITDILVSPSIKDDLDSQTLGVRHKLEQTLLPHGALGVGHVLVVESPTQLEPNYQGDGERPLGMTTLSWPVKYRYRHP